ncbi:nuclear factor 7, ovary-like [Genypterus blacodes]|uniref:nuclear factor 7, ovary-like n=1 Tax=Genypterus blacodes TaxID=154954 RepID=UPI003F7766B7
MMSETEAEPSEAPPDAPVSELTCPICLRLFWEPVSLPCGHVYCFGCLQTMGAGLDQHCCPECQAEYGGTKALVENLTMCTAVETYKATVGKLSSTMNQTEVSRVTAGRNQSTGAEGLKPKHHQDKAKEVREETPGCARVDFKESRQAEGNNTGHTESRSKMCTVSGGKSKREMDEPKFRLASHVTELSLKLELAQELLRREKECEEEVNAANAELREKASMLLKELEASSQSYSEQVMKLIEEELHPGEADVCSRVGKASDLTKQLRRTMLQAESVLTEEDEDAFREEIQILQPHIEELMAKPLGEDQDRVESKINPAQVCPKLELLKAELSERHGEIQRSIRNTLNPSEVTFDPDTAHPNLVLSDDLKTVTFSATKKHYQPSPQRFTSFLQVLSSQSFYGGEHRWEVELEGSPWTIGVCYSGKLARSGLPSALESSRSSWCLMWHDNLLRAFEQSHDVPLKRTTVSRTLEIRLSFKTHRLSFYNLSPVSGRTHIYTFKANLTEPVHLAYRMMSGQPKARITVCS